MSENVLPMSSSVPYILYMMWACSDFIDLQEAVQLSGVPRWLSDKGFTCSAENAGHLGSTPGSGRSPGGESGNPLQYSCLEHLMEREAWRATVHGVAKSLTYLSDWACKHIQLSQHLLLKRLSFSHFTFFFFPIVHSCLLCHRLIDCGGLVAKSCPAFATPWTVARQAPLSVGFSR